MSNTPTTALMASDLPSLSDEAAVQILEFLHEIVFRFEAQYFVQIRRFYDQQLDLFDQAPPSTHISSSSSSSSSFDEDPPF
jgi:hypothetical protein